MFRSKLRLDPAWMDRVHLNVCRCELLRQMDGAELSTDP